MLHHNQKWVDQVEKINITKLTPREVDILACLTRGQSYQDIAGVLTISPKTVSIHMEKIREKLDCHSKKQIIAMAEQSALLPQLNKHYTCLTGPRP